MANYPRNRRRSFVRRMSVLLTLIVAGGGLVALEHTATGASTGTPSSYGKQVHTESKNSGNHDGDPGRHHHGSTTTTASTTTSSSTSTTTTTTMPPRHCHDDHDRHHHKRFKCRVPSGGTGPMHPHDPHHDKKKNGH